MDNLLDCIYESISIYYGMIVYDDSSTLIMNSLLNTLLIKDYPVIKYDIVPDIFTMQDDMSKHRLFIVKDCMLALFITTLGLNINNVNFALTIGKASQDAYKILTKPLKRENMVTVHLQCRC